MKNIILITGDFSTENALEWKQKLNGLAVNSLNLEVDLTQVKEVDLVGVNALVSTHKILSDKGSQLEVILKNGSRMYDMLHLTKFISIFKTKEI